MTACHPRVHRSSDPPRTGVRRLFGLRNECCHSLSAAARVTRVLQREAPAKPPRQHAPAPEGRHKLARSVRAGKENRLSSNFLSRGLLARAFETRQHTRSREAPLFDPGHQVPPLLIATPDPNL